MVATRATCDRLHVGCVIVRENRIITTGYNGAPPGQLHCDDGGHLMIEGHCHRTVHAEANAVAVAAKNGINLDDTTCYLTHAPCLTCAKLLYTAGVCEVIIKHRHGDDRFQETLFAYREGIRYV